MSLAGDVLSCTEHANCTQVKITGEDEISVTNHGSGAGGAAAAALSLRMSTARVRVGCPVQRVCTATLVPAREYSEFRAASISGSEQSQFKALLFQHVTSTRAGCRSAAHHWRCWWVDVTVPAAAAGALWSQCQRCQGSLHQDVLCTSRDCPIFYRFVIFVAAWLHLDTSLSQQKLARLAGLRPLVPAPQLL